jgi:hypothetical protein
MVYTIFSRDLLYFTLERRADSLPDSFRFSFNYNMRVKVFLL